MNKEKTGLPRNLIALSQNAMNTTFTLEISTLDSEVPRAEETLRAALQKIAELESRWSEFRDESEIAVANRLLPGEKVSLSPETAALLARCFQVSLHTDGVFNPSFRSGNGLRFERNFWQDGDTLARLRPESRMGLGAIGKGAALDAVEALLLSEGYRDFRLSAGGSSLIFVGSEAPGVPWRFSVAWRKSEQGYQGVNVTCLETPLRVGISGTLEQGEHIQKRSGEPTGIQLALIEESSAALADAWSTAIFASPNLTQKKVEAGLLLIDNQETLLTNQRFRTCLRIEESP